MSDSVQPHRRWPTRLPPPWDSPGKNTGVGCHFLLQCMKVKSEVKSLSRVRLFAVPGTAAYQAPPSMGFSRQEYWSGVPLPSRVLETRSGKSRYSQTWSHETCRRILPCLLQFLAVCWQYLLLLHSNPQLPHGFLPVCICLHKVIFI